MCIRHRDTTLVIEDAWNKVIRFLSKLKTTKLAIKEWNKTIFGNVLLGIKNLIEAIQELQAQIQDHNRILAEQNLQREQDELL